MEKTQSLTASLTARTCYECADFLPSIRAGVCHEQGLCDRLGDCAGGCYSVLSSSVNCLFDNSGRRLSSAEIELRNAKYRIS